MGAKLVGVWFDDTEAGLPAEPVRLELDCVDFASVGGGGGDSIVALF